MPKREDQQHIVVRSFPSTDLEFADATGDVLQAVLATDEPPATLAEVVQERLRSSYRNVRIQVQDELGHLGASETIWYAYRDGRIRENDPVRERLYEVVAAARRTIQESQLVMDHARKVSRAAGYDEGRDAGDVSVPPRPPADPPRRPRTRSV